jgi:amino acid permease
MKLKGIQPTALPWSAPLQPFISHYTIWGSFLVLITGGFYSFVSFRRSSVLLTTFVTLALIIA